MSLAYSRRGEVYAIRGCETGRVKIGISQSLAKRFTELRRTSPEPLRLIGSVPSTSAHERELHRVLADSQLGGEWFDLGETDEEILDLLRNPEYQPRKSWNPRFAVGADSPTQRFLDDVRAVVAHHWSGLPKHAPTESVWARLDAVLFDDEGHPRLFPEYEATP